MSNVMSWHVMACQMSKVKCQISNVNVMSCHVMAWHGMAWHGMAWHGMAMSNVKSQSSNTKFQMYVVKSVGLVRSQ